MELPDRLVMAPLKRARSGREGVPTETMVQYYTHRASLGLMVSEGIYSSFTGQGNPGMPGLVTEEHVAGWKVVTDSVHAAGGRLVAQLMHSGRVAHPVNNDGHGAVAPSAITVEGMAHTYEGKLPYPVPPATRTTRQWPQLPDPSRGPADHTLQPPAARATRTELRNTLGSVPVGAYGYLTCTGWQPHAAHRMQPIERTPP